MRLPAPPGSISIPRKIVIAYYILFAETRIPFIIEVDIFCLFTIQVRFSIMKPWGSLKFQTGHKGCLYCVIFDKLVLISQVEKNISHFSKHGKWGLQSTIEISNVFLEWKFLNWNSLVPLFGEKNLVMVDSTFLLWLFCQTDVPQLFYLSWSIDILDRLNMCSGWR